VVWKAKRKGILLKTTRYNRAVAVVSGLFFSLLQIGLYCWLKARYRAILSRGMDSKIRRILAILAAAWFGRLKEKEYY
jgi:hypothetical protein